jgi:hypothetical protein
VDNVTGIFLSSFLFFFLLSFYLLFQLFHFFPPSLSVCLSVCLSLSLVLSLSLSLSLPCYLYLNPNFIAHKFCDVPLRQPPSRLSVFVEILSRGRTNHFLIKKRKRQYGVAAIKQTLSGSILLRNVAKILMYTATLLAMTIGKNWWTVTAGGLRGPFIREAASGSKKLQFISSAWITIRRRRLWLDVRVYMYCACCTCTVILQRGANEYRTCTVYNSMYCRGQQTGTTHQRHEMLRTIQSRNKFHVDAECRKFFFFIQIFG